MSAKGTQNKKSRDSFKLEWLKVKVTTDTPDFKNVNVELSSIYEYSFENGLKCKICADCSSLETNTANEYASEKRWEAWKSYYCKRHLLSRIHAENVQSLYNQKHGISEKSLLTEKLADRKARLDHAKRLQTNEEQIRILMDPNSHPKVLSFRPIQEVRWLSRHFAVSAFVRNVDALVLFCEEQINESSDPICTYVLRCIQDPQYFLALYTLNDVLNESANLSKVLQRSALSPIEAHQLGVSKVRKLEAQYLGDNTFWNDGAKQIKTENEDIDTRQMLQSSSKEDHNTFTTTPQEHWWI